MPEGDLVVWALAFALFAFVTALLSLFQLAALAMALALVLAAVVSVFGEGSI
jgi:hypothetical protein